MNINELKPRQGNVELMVEVVNKSEAREFNKFGKAGRVCNAKIKDDTGEVTLTLWNEQIDQVNAGDKIKIKNGYVGEWQGEMQVSTGKFGSLEVIGPSSDEDVAAVTEDELEEEESLEELGKKEPEHALTKDEKEEEEDIEESGDDEELDIEEEKVD